MKRCRALVVLLTASSAVAFSPALVPLGAKALLPLASSQPSISLRSTPEGRAKLTAVQAVDRSYMSPEQLDALAEIEADLTEIFKKYDKNRDGYLTREEYNQWCIDTRRTARMFTGELRFITFCKGIGSDPARGISYDGLVDLYSKKNQQSRGSSSLAAATLPLWGALLACVLLSIPYYLPSCTEYCQKLF